jgi:hypothetical protein
LGPAFFLQRMIAVSSFPRNGFAVIAGGVSLEG